MKYNFLTFLLFLNLIKINYYEKLKLLGDEGYGSLAIHTLRLKGSKLHQIKLILFLIMTK